MIVRDVPDQKPCAQHASMRRAAQTGDIARKPRHCKVLEHHIRKNDWVKCGVQPWSGLFAGPKRALKTRCETRR